jgi:hypothetical protein
MTQTRPLEYLLVLALVALVVVGSLMVVLPELSELAGEVRSSLDLSQIEQQR